MFIDGDREIRESNGLFYREDSSVGGANAKILRETDVSAASPYPVNVSSKISRLKNLWIIEYPSLAGHGST